MKKIISAVLLFSFFSSNVTYAQDTTDLPRIETQQGEVDPGEAISPMKSQQKAPFTGVLLSPKAVATITAKLSSIAEKIRLVQAEATEQAQEVCRNEKVTTEIRVKADKEILEAKIRDNERTIELYQKSLNEAKQSQHDPAVLIGLSAGGAAVLTALSILAVAQSIK
jgi:biopolymer transport protein ExbD